MVSLRLCAFAREYFSKINDERDVLQRLSLPTTRSPVWG